MSVSKTARKFHAVIQEVEADGEEFVVVRDAQPVARIISEPAPTNGARSDERPLRHSGRQDGCRMARGHRTSKEKAAKSWERFADRIAQSMGFLINTEFWSNVERAQLAVAEVQAITRSETVFISPINIAELKTGLDFMTGHTQRLKAMFALRRLKRLPMVRIDLETGEVFGSLAAQLAKTGRGHEFRVQDLWLAAQAIQRRFKFLTQNEKDFKDIPRLNFVLMK